ncbi:hypothetical protein CAPTEDRAFT_210307 [Capitella teleta]|uniref:Uncharacterized protein n=1 Tax=Capitella teleta TaxID=283909 RepID=N1PB69_CAPTE|nr:hypothetical protein CAPTEDRAFT_210307 [Capitella teleta]|eukprot:ELU18836.1 hypothetical protein CAPTEDRAFT_210307 [Capitella teleta]
MEYQAVVLKNSDSEIKLAALDLDHGKAETITESISSVIDECNLWGSIKMIISDTTSVNTGNKAEVGMRQQKMFAIRGHQKPQFIGCQHHVLDQILRWKYCSNDFEELEEALQPYDSALACLRRHWSREDSIINIPRRNQCCEQAMKVMKGKHADCMDKKEEAVIAILLTSQLTIHITKDTLVTKLIFDGSVSQCSEEHQQKIFTKRKDE